MLINKEMESRDASEIVCGFEEGSNVRVVITSQKVWKCSHNATPGHRVGVGWSRIYRSNECET